MNAERLFLIIYRTCFEAGSRVITSRGGTMEDYRDAFQRALVTFYQKLQHSECPNGEEDLDQCSFTLLQRNGSNRVVTGRPCAYLYGITWRLYYKTLQQQIPLELNDQISDEDLGPANEPDDEPNHHYERVAEYIHRNFTEVQQALIYMRHTEGLSYAAISERFKSQFPANKYDPGYLRLLMNRMMVELRQAVGPIK